MAFENLERIKLNCVVEPTGVATIAKKILRTFGWRNELARIQYGAGAKAPILPEMLGIKIFRPYDTNEMFVTEGATRFLALCSPQIRERFTIMPNPTDVFNPKDVEALAAGNRTMFYRTVGEVLSHYGPIHDLRPHINPCLMTPARVLGRTGALVAAN